MFLYCYDTVFFGRFYIFFGWYYVVKNVKNAIDYVDLVCDEISNSMLEEHSTNR